MTPFIVLYLLIFVIIAGGSGLGVMFAIEHENEEDQRFLSRMVLISPVWPLALAVFVIWSIKPLLKMSGWIK